MNRNKYIVARIGIENFISEISAKATSMSFVTKTTKRKNYISFSVALALAGLLLCIPSIDAQRQTARPVMSNSNGKPASNNKAKAAPRSRVQYVKNFMKKDGDSLVIDMDVDMSKIGLKPNQAQILVPVVGSQSAGEELELPSIMIQGTARNKAFTRELELDEKAYEEFEKNLPYAIVKPKGKLNYHLAIPYEDWMSNAYLDIEEDLCGCGDKAKISRSRIFDKLSKDPAPAEPAYRVRQQCAYIQPEVEVIKHRSEIGNAYLDFPRGKSEILPRFGNNEVELSKIDNMIRTVSTHKDVTVQGIYMTGYASPESSLKFNTELSDARAKAMMDYFAKNSSIPRSMYEVHNGGEDWEGFRKLLEEFPIGHKNEIFRLMNTVKDLDAREKAISKVGGGAPYKIIYDELYPKLRRVVCEVAYTVKNFSLEEAKSNLESAPQLLSLNEMYIVANTYETGSPEFLRVFEIARQEFPDDPTANLNGAAAALMKNNLRDAEKYLKLADSSTPEYANNKGVFEMLKGNYREAEQLLKQAESAGISEASINLRELRKKLANINSRRDAGTEENDDNASSESTTTTKRRR